MHDLAESRDHYRRIQLKDLSSTYVPAHMRDIYGRGVWERFQEDSMIIKNSISIIGIKQILHMYECAPMQHLIDEALNKYQLSL
jgi:hypothetical protein